MKFSARSSTSLILFFFIACALAIFVCCGPKRESQSNLSFKVTPNTSFILPGESDTGCYTKSVKGPRLFYPGVTLTWAGPDNFYPAVIQIKVTSPHLGGSFKCLIDKNVANLFAKSITPEPTPPATAPPVTTNYLLPGTYIVRDGCALECGGLKLVDENTSFKIVGEAKMIGYSINSNNDQTPAISTSTIFLENIQ